MTRPSRVPTHTNVPYGSPLAALPRVIVTILSDDDRERINRLLTFSG